MARRANAASEGMASMNHKTTIWLGAAALCAAAAGLSGCRGDRSDAPPRQFFPDMDDSPKFKNQGKTDFFVDGRKMRPSVPGAVAFGYGADPEDPTRAKHLKDDTRFFFGKASTAADAPFVDDIPVPVTMAMIERGKERYNIYCSVCHGYDGKGKGLVGDTARRTGWSYALPNFHDETGKYTDKKNQPTAKDGYLFHVIRNGVLNPDGTWKMPPYGHAVKEADAWAIVSYIRTLQAMYAGRLEDAPEAEQARLKAARPVNPNAKGAN
jgi:mono/diheme cytochrome c family protein